jgi:plasmid stability protein
MAEIEVLDIDDELMARLAERADQRGHSVEDEVRTILERVLRMPSESELLDRARKLEERDRKAD